MTKTLLSAALAFGLAATAANAEPVNYALDASHSQIVFTYEHLGFSTTTGVFSGFEGDIVFDDAAPAESSVSVAFPADTLYTGWKARTAHFLGADFFDAETNPTISFVSTGIEVTGEKTGLITGDLTINGITNPVTLDAEMTKQGAHPRGGTPWVGFNASTTVLRSDFDMGNAAPFVSDEVTIELSIEAGSQ
jgi:polyisoprenoid-binding protein YceI